MWYKLCHLLLTADGSMWLTFSDLEKISTVEPGKYLDGNLTRDSQIWEVEKPILEVSCENLILYCCQENTTVFSLFS